MFLELPANIKNWIYLWAMEDWIFIAGLDRTDNPFIRDYDYELFYLSMPAGRIYKVSYFYGILATFPLDNISRMDTFFRYFTETRDEANLVTVKKKLEPYLVLYNL
jgi:hypothetical protein